jgi:phage terminase small subunit
MSNAIASPLPVSSTVEVLPRALEPLTDKQEAFSRALVECGNMSLAYRRAYSVGVMTKSATVWKAAQLVAAHPSVRARVHELQEAAAAHVVFSKQRLVEFLWTRICADRSQIIRQVVRCCRHCHGIGHLFQWKDELEYATACAKAVAERATMPNCDGGFGFDPHLPPVDSCNVGPCLGDGVTSTVIADTMTLQGGAAAIYEGVDRFGLPILADRSTDIALFMKVTGWSTSDLEGALRGAAAGGAAGALAASAVVEKVKAMDSEDTRRAYLTFTTGG